MIRAIGLEFDAVIPTEDGITLKHLKEQLQELGTKIGLGAKFLIGTKVIQDDQTVIPNNAEVVITRKIEHM